MECRGDADPSPVYTWYKDGDLLTPERMGDLGVNLISNEEHSQLEFPSPTNIQEGFYHCEARNDLGKNNNHKMFFVFHSLFLVFPTLLRILATHISSSGLALSSVTHVSSLAAPPPQHNNNKANVIVNELSDIEMEADLVDLNSPELSHKVSQ